MIQKIKQLEDDLKRLKNSDQENQLELRIDRIQKKLNNTDNYLERRLSESERLKTKQLNDYMEQLNIKIQNINNQLTFVTSEYNNLVSKEGSGKKQAQKQTTNFSSTPPKVANKYRRESFSKN